MDCPSSLLLYQFAQGAMEADQREVLAAHVSGCKECERRIHQIEALPPRRRSPAAIDDPDEVTRNLEPVALDFDGEDSAASRLPTVPEPVDEDSATLMRNPSPDANDAGPASSSGWSSATMRTRTIPRGTPIGRYLIVEPLGSGGLGDVYTAYDPELDRCVAIKVLRPSADEPEGPPTMAGSGASSGRDRLVREAKALARLSHPNVVAVYDVGRVGEDVFIAMERVEGMTLSRWCQAETRHWRQVRDVFLGVGAGVAAAHDAGIVHRDLKPQNVIVSADGRPRVLDFGLARAVRGQSGVIGSQPRELGLDPSSVSDSLDDSVTMAGMVMGTPQYMAPEQFEGADRTGPRSDQFSFCVMMWGALYGQLPFQADEIIELIKVVYEGIPIEPTDRRGVPGWLHKVLLRGMSVDPSRRFASMEALMYAMQRDRRSRRMQWIGLGLAALVSGLGTGVVTVALRPPVTDELRDGVDTLADEARVAAARSLFVYPALDDEEAVTAYRKVLELERQEGPANDLAQQRAAELRAEFSQTLRRLGDRYYERDGGKPFATDYYAAALIFDPDDAHSRERTSLTPGELVSLRERAAEGEFSAAELTAAASLVVLAVEDGTQRREHLAALYAGDQAPSPSTSARLEALLGDEEVEVIAQVTASRRNSRRRLPQDEPPAGGALRPTEPPITPEPAAVLETSPAAVGTGEDDKATSIPEPTQRNPSKAKELVKQGMAAFRQGRFSKSETLLHRALGYDRRNATALAGLAELHFQLGRYQKAVQYASKAVGAAPRRGQYRMLLGDSYFKTLDYPLARREYEKAQQLGHASAAKRLAQLDKRLGK